MRHETAKRSARRGRAATCRTPAVPAAPWEKALSRRRPSRGGACAEADALWECPRPSLFWSSSTCSSSSTSSFSRRTFGWRVGTFLFLAEGESAAQRTQAISRNFWDRLTPYDGQWYLDISAKGYRTFPVEPRANAEARAPRGNFAFFPLLPAILSAATAIFGAGMLPVVLLALLVASACGVAFSGLLAREFSIPAGLTLALLLAFPTAPFQLVLYTESLFLPLSAGALWLALRRRAGWAALAVGGLCGLSRPQGILLVLPYFTEFLLPAIRRRERLSWSAWLRRLAVVASPSAGVIAMGYFSAVAAGSPLAFLKVQSGWGRSYELSNLLTSLGSAVDYAGPRSDLPRSLPGGGALARPVEATPTLPCALRNRRRRASPLDGFAPLDGAVLERV